MSSTQKMMWIFVDEMDLWDDSKLYEQIVILLERRGISGATVLTGTMGFGVHRRIHRKGLFGVSDERPVAIAVVDTEEKLRDVLESIRPMVRQGLILLTDVEVIPLGSEAGA